MTTTTTGSVAEGFSGKRTAEIVGITYRQLDYWARTDLVRPSLADAAGSGSRRRYSYRDLLELKIIKKLLDAGLRLETVRDVFSYLRENLGEDVASANLVISDGQVMLATSDQEMIDLIRQGQGVLNLLPLEGVKAEIDAVVALPSPSSAAQGAGPAEPTAEAATGR
ncbi:MAG: MerR family transcriptional regulator [Acidimicrobiales bacterium]|nr:MerR family transcriptional regulator [Acidimicrobiales bacterium]MCB9371415.1 MerR family transcriptional regulator [Microthrixaceae bacterium]